MIRGISHGVELPAHHVGGYRDAAQAMNEIPLPAPWWRRALCAVGVHQVKYNGPDPCRGCGLWFEVREA